MTDEAAAPNDEGNKAPGADQGPEQEGGPHSGQQGGGEKQQVKLDTRTSVTSDVDGEE